MENKNIQKIEDIKKMIVFFNDKFDNKDQVDCNLMRLIMKDSVEILNIYQSILLSVY